jgi:hypothetical protein
MGLPRKDHHFRRHTLTLERMVKIDHVELSIDDPGVSLFLLIRLTFMMSSGIQRSRRAPRT